MQLRQHPKSKGNAHTRDGFTLMELLVVITIIAILAGVAFPLFSSINKQGKQTKEVAAAKNLITYYLSYAAENNGVLMEGISSGESSAVDSKGATKGSAYAKRYPYRLAPYYKFQPEGVVVTNESVDFYKKASDKDYSASLYPSFGLNTTFVGGNYQTHNGDPTIEEPDSSNHDHVVTRLSQAESPGNLIVFASARSKVSKTEAAGFGNFYITSPYLSSYRWRQEYSETANPSGNGYIALRYAKKAVVANLGGNVEMLDREQLKDMRRWCNTAAVEDNPKFTLN